MRRVVPPNLRIVEGGRCPTRSGSKARAEARIWHPAAGRPRPLTLYVNNEVAAAGDQSATDHAVGVILDFSAWR
jgi:hypothetical protein